MLVEDFDLMMKVIVVGDGQVGKTSMITRFVKNKFSTEYKKTLGCDYLQKTMVVGGDEVTFHVWDTAGQEEFNALTRRYYKGSSAAILAFSTTNRASFVNIQKWRNAVIDECKEGLPMVLVQTKIDLIDEAQVTTAEAEDLALLLRIPLIRVCAKDNVMIREVFEFLANKYFQEGHDLAQIQDGVSPIQTVEQIQDSYKTPARISAALSTNTSAIGSFSTQNTTIGNSLPQQQFQQRDKTVNSNIKLEEVQGKQKALKKRKYVRCSIL